MSIYDHLEFRHLKYILAIAEEGTFTAAAARVHVAQSALSRQIRELEDVLGVQIFEPGSSALTSAGQSLLRFAPQLLEMRRELVDALQALHHASLQPFRLPAEVTATQAERESVGACANPTIGAI